MKLSFLVLAAATLMVAGAAQPASAKGRGTIMPSAPTTGTVTPMPSTPPQVNPGALGGPNEIGTPPVNAGTIAPPTQQTINSPENFGALPGAPGSATYDPNAALPSFDNPGSALAPNPSTSAAGFGSPNTNSGTTPSLNGGGQE